MTVFISYDLSDGPHGGGNQFLKIVEIIGEDFTKYLYKDIYP